MKKTIDQSIKNCLNDIQKQLLVEFDLNFERAAFFTEKWAKRRVNIRGDRRLLMDSGALRKSIKASQDKSRVVFYSYLPYAEIHNEGGVIAITARMKRYFWAKYMEQKGGLDRKKTGEPRKNARNREVNGLAGFYKAMAMKKVGSKIKIPRRRFLGSSPEVEKMIGEIATKTMKEFLNDYEIKLK